MFSVFISLFLTGFVLECHRHAVSRSNTNTFDDSINSHFPSKGIPNYQMSGDILMNEQQATPAYIQSGIEHGDGELGDVNNAAPLSGRLSDQAHRSIVETHAQSAAVINSSPIGEGPVPPQNVNSVSHTKVRGNRGSNKTLLPKQEDAAVEEKVKMNTEIKETHHAEIVPSDSQQHKGNELGSDQSHRIAKKKIIRRKTERNTFTSEEVSDGKNDALLEAIYDSDSGIAERDKKGKNKRRSKGGSDHKSGAVGDVPPELAPAESRPWSQTMVMR